MILLQSCKINNNKVQINLSFYCTAIQEKNIILKKGNILNTAPDIILQSLLKDGASFCYCTYILCISSLVQDIQVS